MAPFLTQGVLLFTMVAMLAHGHLMPYHVGKHGWGTDKSHAQIAFEMQQLHSMSGVFQMNASTYEVYPSSNKGAPVEAKADITHHRHEDYSNNTYYSGHSFTLRNPYNHFAVLQPLGGCDTNSRAFVRHTAQENQCRVATNAGFFDPDEPGLGECFGNLVVAGDVLQNTGKQNGGSNPYNMTYK